MVTLAVLGVVFLAGAIAGILALVCMSINREESRDSLRKTPPSRAARATRRLLGWHGIPASGRHDPQQRIRSAKLSTGSLR